MYPAQHTATQCSTLQHTAIHFSTLQHTYLPESISAAHCNTLQHTAAHCSTLQHTATHCNTLQRTAAHCNTLQHTCLPAVYMCSTRTASHRWSSLVYHTMQHALQHALQLTKEALKCTTHCNTHCNTQVKPSRVPCTRRTTLHGTTTLCNTLQRSATHCIMYFRADAACMCFVYFPHMCTTWGGGNYVYVYTYLNVYSQWMSTTHYNTRQHTAYALQCVAVCCSVLQCVVDIHWM